MWQKSYEVYVEDRHRLGLKEFFVKQNPHARQNLLARLVEVDRQGSHRFTAEQRAVLIREYLRSVVQNGVGCSANICGNRALQRYVAAQARSSIGGAEARAFQARLDRAFRSSIPRSAALPASRPQLARRPFRMFHVSMAELAVAHPAVRIGSAVFLLFFAASALLGAGHALGLRRIHQPLVELNVARK